MPREIARRLIGGRWRTADVEEDGGNGGSQPKGIAQSVDFLFTEEATAGVYTAEWDVPAGAVVRGFQWFTLAGPWAADSALTKIGDVAEPQGYLSEGSIGSGGDFSTSAPYDPEAPDNDVNYYNAGTTNGPYFDAIKSAGGSDQPGVHYPSGGTITAIITTLIASEPVVPAGVALLRIFYTTTPDTPTDATFS